MAVPNLFQELKNALTDFKKFLDDNVGKIAPAIKALRSVIPQITELLDKLIDLLKKLKAEVDKLDVGNIPGLNEVSTFTQSVKTLLETSKNLLPDEAATIDDVLAVADVVTGLPSVKDVKKEIGDLIDAIIVHLNSLKS